MADMVPSSPESPRVDALTETLVCGFPDRFSPDQIEKLRQQVGQIEATVARLRAYPLTNADEPEPIFHATPAEG